MQGRKFGLIAGLLLSGCAPAGFEALPVIVEYSPKVQAQAAIEIDQMPAGAALPVLIADYAVLRAQIRALRTGQ